MRRSKQTSGSPVVDVLVASIDQGFDRKSWHGTNLRGALRGLTARQAAWRPAPGRHSVWDLVLHAAYWKYAVRRRLLGEKRGSFPLPGSNWFSPGDRSEAAWRSSVRLLEEMHRSMRSAVLALRPADLRKKAKGGTTTVLGLVTGIAAHDLYHAGQIQLLKRLGAGR
jgi:uncharacterized damage-inducible protein DinB